MIKNKQVVLAKRPLGEPTDDCFRIEESEIPELADNQILIKVCWLSLDPYIRGRMNDVKSYTEPLAIDDIMTGESTGIVIKSTSTEFAVGDRVAAHMGWQSYIVANADDPRLMKVDLNNGTLSAHLGVVGMPGRTAYFGLTEVGKPQPGETLVVAAASGAVGSAVGQIAKIKGLRVVGIAGGPEKCRYVKEELKFDDCIDYKAGNLAQELKAACPDGVDIYFENVGGDVTKAVAPLLNSGARVPICGYISNYNDEDITKAVTPFHILAELDEVPEHRFFVVTEFHDRWVEATRLLGSWVGDGKLKYKESVGEGLENAADLFRGMLKGKNFGKQLVKIADED
ncbi:MAG: NADP-dependent oxidoreductase [SAR86 cluster bacterium]|uniref:NADP-dependent oxidoreductase n=1 Tax=SAR86 cluster bacterium TaxID=2030880 RepID=A0A2A5AZU2_9GAMM|nr:MAG: NADP-dependent oxidoreductase [SAR86 cluster bacterium]